MSILLRFYLISTSVDIAYLLCIISQDSLQAVKISYIIWKRDSLNRCMCN
uniref:Uncharacterized protein n=1 Tax=Aegilops tauschii subsp. strangulata TaxID=200361 RepID=A0A453I0K6_AEGTS